ncbi:MAG TPA: hypothetical protein VLY45_06110 [Nitrospiria bacterium]|nr:hypothetical protein [Nitrospiria bacterium]
MNLDVEQERAHLMEAVDEVSGEMERAAEEGATLEDIEGAKTLAAELIDRYEGVLKQLNPAERGEMRQQIGGFLEQVKEKLIRLKEAPE